MRGVLIWMVLLWSATAVGADFLVSGESLAAEMKQGRVRLIDAETAESYQRAHLPGAAHLPYLDLEDFEENLKNGQPAFAQLAASKFAALGLTREADVVVYDSGDGRAASAIWYMLRFLGHDKVRILDGGFRKWLKEGRTLTQEAPKLAKATYVPKPRTDWAVKSADLARAAVLLDARSLAEYTGKESGGAKQGGHIPGAKSFPWTQLAGELATFKSPETMKKALAAAGITPDKEIVTYCNGGLGRSTHLLAALNLAGYDKVKVYPGSWIEWAADPARPIER
ncbi:MAG: sulfurtransferase [Rhodocyclaceae bacterium]|nr:sulfurtransferase [Rhodocyclaceae bacterium]